MQPPRVTEISRKTYADVQKARHQTQLRRVRESLFLAAKADAKRP
jgi:hypothetical protein